MNEVTAQQVGSVIPGMEAFREEPPIGTVLVYQVQHGARSNPFDTQPSAESINRTRTYHYASIRVSDGRWYTTGRKAEQGVDWVTLSGALRDSQAQVWTATGWAAFEL